MCSGFLLLYDGLLAVLGFSYGRMNVSFAFVGFIKFVIITKSLNLFLFPSSFDYCSLLTVLVHMEVLVTGFGWFSFLILSNGFFFLAADLLLSWLFWFVLISFSFLVSAFVGWILGVLVF